ncbi:cation:proton antiporter [Commensalibacter oyaizuii]|uniref:Sodium:proton antiporter n=1 Tax=Commensalibacter oyaizuii TaxID=3043873 RepID=A0ABT6PZD5_9PROT|nr:sodium:proton antiporter [Commensalibacter sp. TBRC 16381]MDI2090223.1 sodium:proton antiporter [Commensalibacter sp. TBRC 16381]
MDLLTLISLLFLLTAIAGAINHKFLHLPITIGIMIMAFVFSLVLFISDYSISFFSGYSFAQNILSGLNFPTLLLNGVLAFLLFAGSLHIHLDELWKAKYNVASLAILGTLICIFTLGIVFWGLFSLFSLPISFIWCLVLGSILAPTDPVAIINMLGRLGLPFRMQAIFAGESLFNDGIALMAFTTLIAIATSNHTPNAGGLLLVFIQEVFGSGILGAVTAYIVISIIKRMNHDEVIILFSLALAAGTFSMANHFHMSGPIAVVVSGLLMGNYLQKRPTKKDHDTITGFWHVIDELLNTLLFLLIGLEIMVIPFHYKTLIISLLCIPFLILCRFIAIGISGSVLLYKDSNPKGLISILTWGGLRGGISLAIALSLPDIFPKNEILVITYVCVIFTVVVQGLTMERLINHFYKLR